MKKVFTIFLIADKEIHVPSTDYYARNNDVYVETLPMLQQAWDFDTEEEAEEYLTTDSELFSKGTYIILPTYKKE